MLRNQTKTRLEQSSAQLEEAKKQISTKEQEHSEALTALQTKLDAATANAESESGVKAVAEAQGQWNEEKKQLEQRNETHLARAKEFLSLRVSGHSGVYGEEGSHFSDSFFLCINRE